MNKDSYTDLFGISHQWLSKIFPFYLLISKKSQIIDKGPGFDWLDVNVCIDDLISEKFTPLYFFKELNYEFIKNDSDDEVIFKDLQNNYTLKGKAYFFSDTESMLFLSSINIHNAEIAGEIKLHDFEPFNQTLDMIFLKAMQEAESKKSLALIRQLEKKAHDLEAENKKISSGRVILNGAKIRQLRQSRLMTVDGFVIESQQHKCYISKSTIKRAEAGVQVYFRTALDIANILNVNVHEILR